MPAPFDADFHATNRARFFAALGGDAALLVGSPTHLRNGDSEYRYRPSSDVLYLTGWEDPEVAMLFLPGADQPFVMFVQPRNPDVEVWTGRRAGPEGAIERFGADAAFPIGDLGEMLPDLLQGYRNLHYRFAIDAEYDQMLIAAIAQARKKARRTRLDVPDAFVDPSRALHEMRLIKHPVELARLEEAAAITVAGHSAAMAMTAPGVMEYQLEAEIERVFRSRGGNGPGYTTIVGGAENATILHYVSNRDRLRDGTLVCVDAGCEYGYYTADVTRTWPVNGRFTGPQRALYEVVLAAQLASIDRVRVGEPFADIHSAATRVLTEGMVDLGLLDGDVDELIEDGAQKRWYMHGTSHWLGMDVHDVGAYHSGGESRLLEQGMVMTVEPGLYVPVDADDAPPDFRGIGIRIEDDVLVTDGAPQVLTAALPTRIEDIEALVGSAVA